MLPDKELAKLCPGRIILANAYNSAGTDATEPHYCVILNAHPNIAGRFFVAFISHNDKIDSKFVIPTPSYTGLTGSIIGSWTDYVDEPGVLDVKSKLLSADLLKVLALVKMASAKTK